MDRTWFRMGVSDHKSFPKGVDFDVLWFGVGQGGNGDFDRPVFPRSFDLKLDSLRVLLDEIEKKKSMEFTRVSDHDTVNLHHASMVKEPLDFITLFVKASDYDLLSQWEFLPVGSLTWRNARIGVLSHLEPTKGFSKLAGLRIDYVVISGARVERDL